MAAPLTGLSSTEVLERRQRGLGNNADIQTGRTYTQILKENVFTFINNVLFLLGLALVLLGRPSDALVSVGVIFINVIVSLYQELRAKHTLDQIALLTRPTAKVVRDGQEQSVDPSEIVLGDVLKVEPGDQVVVDGTVLRGEMEADESLLTGESDRVKKGEGAEVFSGSYCVSGSAYYEAAKVGADSLANRITAGARAFKRVLTPIQKETNLLVRVVLLIALYFEILLLVNTLLNSIPIVDSVKMSVVIAGLVPNGLFVSIALSYALGAIRIAGRGALVQQSNAVESLANVDVLCLDKTGTLTANRIHFHELAVLTDSPEQVHQVLGDYAASTDAGNRTNEAIAKAFPGQKRAVAIAIPFASERKWSALSFAQPELPGTYVLGALEMLAPSLTSRDGLEEKSKEWSDAGLRVLLLTHCPDSLTEAEGDEEPQLPDDLRPLGLLSFGDELRPEARETLAAFQKAGVQLKIISGDNPQTVAALAVQAGMPADLPTVSGLELAEMDHPQFAQSAVESTIFGRITPQQKENLVRALRDHGHYVAMIGDGVNDVLSLKQANLGIAMQSGSQATRGVAGLVLLDDSFKVLPYAVREGQRIVNGMQDILKLFLTRIIYVILLIISTGFISGFPFSPKQSSIVALLAVGLPTMALAAWSRPARLSRTKFLRRLMHFVLPAAALQSIFGLGVYLAYLVPAYQNMLGASLSGDTSAVFDSALLVGQTALAIFSILCGLLLLVFVEPPNEWWAGGDALSGDRRPAWMAAGMLAAFVTFLAIPQARAFFDFFPLKFYDYLLIGLAAAAWGFVLRLVWRKSLLDRFLEVDLSGQ